MTLPDVVQRGGAKWNLADSDSTLNTASSGHKRNCSLSTSELHFCKYYVKILTLHDAKRLCFPPLTHLFHYSLQDTESPISHLKLHYLKLL